MSDFIKIFLVLCGLVVAFLTGRNYGEKSFHTGEEYKTFVKATEELNYAKSELENVKAKLQNITDGAETKKTDEILAQILQVFLADLGLRIQNKEAILKQAAQAPEPAVVAATMPEIKTVENVVEKQPTPEIWKPSKVNRFKSFEWIVTNSNGDQDTLRQLKKVQIKDLNGYLRTATFEDRSDCDDFLGVYKGTIKDLNKKYYGSLSFDLRSSKAESYNGHVELYTDRPNNKFSEKIGNNCGKKIKNLAGRVFYLANDKYIQMYKLVNQDKTAGNYYEVMPGGTTNLIGSFLLSRVDKF